MSFLILNSGNTALGHTLMTMISFIVLLLIIRKFAWAPLLNILDERAKKIHDDLSKAESEKTDSLEANRLAQDDLRKSKTQASQIILQAKKHMVYNISKNLSIHNSLIIQQNCCVNMYRTKHVNTLPHYL